MRTFFKPNRRYVRTPSAPSFHYERLHSERIVVDLTVESPVRKRGRLVRNVVDLTIDSPELSDAHSSPVNPVLNDEPFPASPVLSDAQSPPVNPVPNDQPSPVVPLLNLVALPPDDHVASIMASDDSPASFCENVVDIDYIDVRVLVDRFRLLLGTDFINLSNPMLKKVCKLLLFTSLSFPVDLSYHSTNTLLILPIPLYVDEVRSGE